MSHVDFVFPPAVITSLPVEGTKKRFPVRRIYCVGRNYAAHAVEMGHNPDAEPPFFFQKNPDNLVTDGSFPYPPMSTNVHFELEQVVALGKGGRDIARDDALKYVFGYAVGLDMTRRDLQSAAKKSGRPWEVGKAFEHSVPCSTITPVSEFGHPDEGSMVLTVNDEVRQSGDLDQLIWKVPEIIAQLSALFELQRGDLIMTGTPAGVGAVSVGDRLSGTIEGIGKLDVDVVRSL